MPSIDPTAAMNSRSCRYATEAPSRTCWPSINTYRQVSINISKHEQRVLHALAQGGSIIHRFDEPGRIVEIDYMNREEWRLDDYTMTVFQKLRRKQMISSVGGSPYRITREGLRAVRSQLDKR